MTVALWTAAQAQAATGGHFGLKSDEEWTATGVSIDSRTLAPGDLFVALKGERGDGHDHVAEAVRKGAAACVVSRVDDELPAGAELLVVPDTLDALRRLGAAARARTRARIAAVTGSVGKTSTKEALRAVLAAHGPTHASVSSYNNHIGVPLTLARMPAESAYGVFEIGMNHAGEISPLAQLVRPQIAIVTTVEAVHVENFPDNGIDGVAAAKAEIFEGGPRVAILNRDNRYFEFLSQRAHASGVERVVSFGSHAEADAHLTAIEPDGEGSRISAVIEGRALIYRLGAPGRHWALNSLAVLAAADELDLDLVAASAALAAVRPVKGRGQRHVVRLDGGSFELIDESYNASPVSMRAAFDVLAARETRSGGRRIAVLGDMLELGPESPALHAGLAPAIVAANIDLVFACGPLMRNLFDALPADRRGAHAASSAELTATVCAAVRTGDAVMVKGSLGSRMGPIVAALLDRGR